MNSLLDEIIKSLRKAGDKPAPRTNEEILAAMNKERDPFATVEPLGATWERWHA